MQSTLFSCLGGPDIITATTNPGLHPNPLLPLAQDWKAEGRRVMVVPSVGLGHRGRPPPWSPAGLGSGCCECFQFPGAMRAGRGSCSHPVVTRWGGGQLGPKFQKSSTFLPVCLSPSLLLLLLGHSGKAGQRAAGRVEDRGLCLGVTLVC